nr:ATP-binding protein [Suipraeoptans intestinalis]
MIERVLFNLVENGIKYNREGGNVQVSTEDLPDRVKIRIADTGVGIREEDKPHVFDLFYRVDESRNRETGATESVWRWCGILWPAGRNYFSRGQSSPGQCVWCVCPKPETDRK